MLENPYQSPLDLADPIPWRESSWWRVIPPVVVVTTVVAALIQLALIALNLSDGKPVPLATPPTAPWGTLPAPQPDNVGHD